jgi:hypothetical protein
MDSSEVDMSKMILALASILVLGGCDFDMTGLGAAISEAFCDGPCPPPPPPPPPAPPERELAVTVLAFVGDHSAFPGEYTIHLYAAGDTAAPIRSWDDQKLWFGEAPDPEVCAYLVRATLWTGATSEIQSLFSDPPAECRPDRTDSSRHVVEFRFPAYVPLGKPFVITGRVWMSDRPAHTGEVMARLWLLGAATTPVATNEEGFFTYSTDDPVDRMWFCLWASAEVSRVSDGATEAETRLEGVSSDVCGGGRRLPDVRIGSGWPPLGM